MHFSTQVVNTLYFSVVRWYGPHNFCNVLTHYIPLAIYQVLQYLVGTGTRMRVSVLPHVLRTAVLCCAALPVWDGDVLLLNLQASFSESAEESNGIIHSLGLTSSPISVCVWRAEGSAE